VVTGLLYGGGLDQLKAQFIGSAAVTAATFGVALILMYAVNATGTLRISKEGELRGLDLNEHGGVAYPEMMSPGGIPTHVVEPPMPARAVQVPASASGI